MNTVNTTPPTSHIEDIFGVNVFGPETMRQCLDSATIAKIEHAAATGEPLDKVAAEAMAAALHRWAVERGATHYAHVFYPLHGQTAEKHDALFALGEDGRLAPSFNARCLVNGEPDASSFPSGGLRTMFEARGVTSWDPRCPPYLVDTPEHPGDVVLAIPSTFTSAAGDALDEKTPLARSERALASQSERILKVFGIEDEGPVHVSLGIEQEYFLIDRGFLETRPDLAICGRTLLGARPPKGQEFEDQYFGAIPKRVQAYMLDFERELWRLGIAAQTRHNEVAPGQYEFVPYFERAHLACDHQQMIMQVMQQVAVKHGFACLFHEKPFAGVNGSGKHVNWSLHTTRRNLCRAGSLPEGNVLFLIFAAAVVRAVHRYGSLMRAVIASAGNDLRLGGDEAPPAIISIFMGEKLSGIFEELATGASDAACATYDDRNRTSPFAFTGNKFEFRSVGASQAVSGAVTVLNTAVTEALDWIATRLEESLTKVVTPEEREVVARGIIVELYRKHGAVVFNGDGYSAAWREEAARRGLPIIDNSVDAFAAYDIPDHIELFTRYGVMTEREIHSRAEIQVDRYVKQVATESVLCLSLCEQFVLPAAYRHQGELAQTAAAMKQVGVSPHLGQLNRATHLVRAMEDAVEDLRGAIAKQQSSETEMAQAQCCRDAVLPAMLAAREAADAIETSVAVDLWPLSPYRDILFML